MSVEDIIRKFDRGLCRCCHAEGIFHDLDHPRFILDQKEVYAEMLKDSFDIDIKPISGPFCKMTYSICDSCIVRLRDATNFKHQVQLCEKKLKDYYDQVMDDTSIMKPGKSEKRGGDKLPYSMLRDVLTSSGTGSTSIVEIKVEDSDEERDIKKEPPMDDDADDGFTFRFGDDDDDDEDHKTMIEIKLEQEEEMKSSSTRKSARKIPQKPAQKANILKKTIPAKKTYTAKKPSTVKKATKTKAPETKTKAPETKAQTESEPEAKKSKGPKIMKRKFHLRDSDFRKEGEEYHCARCDKKYLGYETLHVHVKRKHYNILPNPCSYCDKRFMTYKALAKHKLQEHNVDIRAHCNACNAIFNRKSDLRAHIQSFHMLGEKYKCDSCEFESYNMRNMSRHQIKHKTQKDFHCRFCKKSFRRKTNLDLHEKIHTGDKRKVCKVCGQAFVQKASLNYHMTKYHPEVNF